MAGTSVDDEACNGSRLGGLTCWAAWQVDALAAEIRQLKVGEVCFGAKW